MSREWSPGDVAYYDGLRVMFVQDSESGVGLTAVDEEGFSRYGEVFKSRPLVVIDPADPEQTERLAAEIAKETAREGLPHQLNTKKRAIALRRALREIVNPTPPKPEEPTGLGAVVEDAKGVRWVRTYEHTSFKHWVATQKEHDNQCWDRIDAVKILKEGL